MIRFRDLLRDKNFLFLWLGQVISNFGDRLNQMALIALIFERTPGSAIALAKLIALTIIPVFLIGPVAGAWVDRLNKRNTMIICDLLRGMLVLSIPYFISRNQILPIYLVVFLTFSVSRFFIPSKMAMIPDLVSREKLLVANTLSDTTHMIGNIVGLVAAGIIVNIAFIGAVGGFYIDASSFFISAALITMIAQKEFVKGVRGDLEMTKAAFKSSLRRSILDEVKEGMKYLTRHDDMHFIVYVFFLLMAGVGAISCVIIVFIQEAFATSTRDLGFIGMFLAAGLFFGTLAYGRFGQKISKRKMIHFSFVLSGIFIALFTFFVSRHPNLLMAGILSACLGMAAGPITVSTTTLTHETIPEETRGRIFSSLEAVIHLAFLAFMFLAAYIARYIGRFWILMTAGLVFSACGMAGLFSERSGTK